MLLRPLRVANNTPHERTPAQWLRVQFCTVESWAKHKYWDRTQHTTNFHANNHLHGPGVLTLVRVPVCPNRLTDQTWNATTRQDDFALSTDQCRQSAVFTQLLLWTHIYMAIICHMPYSICHMTYLCIQCHTCIHDLCHVLWIVLHTPDGLAQQTYLCCVELESKWDTKTWLLVLTCRWLSKHCVRWLFGQYWIS